MNNTMHEIIEDIYKETGQKVEINDPIVAAALIQSRIIKNAIAEIKSTLPNEISKQAVEDFKKTINDSRKEIVDITNGHKEHLMQVHKETFSSLKESIAEHTNSLDYSINNNLLYLGLFGFSCSILGGLFAAIIIKFVI